MSDDLIPMIDPGPDSDLRAFIEQLEARAFAMAGISEPSIDWARTGGLSSAAALREWVEIVEGRLLARFVANMRGR
jgi:hypothetical protein